MRALAVVVVIACISGPVAAGSRVAGVVLPTRRGDADRLDALAARLAVAVAQRLGGTVVAIPRSHDIADRFERARTLALDAKLDEAAATYDLALDAADRDPASVDPRALIAAHVSRAQIALARGEAGRADGLLRQLLRWGADFAPTADEATPAVRDVLARVAPEVVSATLDAGDLGEACTHADTTIVLRATRGDGVEIARFDGCVRTAATSVAGALDEAAVVERLAPEQARAAAHRSLVRRPVFWIVVSAVAVSAIGVAAWRVSREPGGYDVAIRF